MNKANIFSSVAMLVAAGLLAIATGATAISSWPSVSSMKELANGTPARADICLRASKRLGMKVDRKRDGLEIWYPNDAEGFSTEKISNMSSVYLACQGYMLHGFCAGEKCKSDKKFFMKLVPKVQNS